MKNILNFIARKPNQQMQRTLSAPLI